MSRSTITPFWERLPSFALYPFKGSALIALIVFSALISLVGLVPWVGWLLALLLWLGAYKQAFEMLVATAHGRMDVPAVTQHVSDGMVMRYVVLQLFLLVMPALMGWGLGGTAGLFTMLFLGLITPAATMGLAMSGDLDVAMDPANLLRVISRIGWPYVAMVGLTLVIPWSAQNAQSVLVQWMPLMAAEALGTVFSLWALFATFHLMGYLIWQYHETLGFSPDAPLRSGRMAAGRDIELLARAEELIADGHLDAAITLLRNDVRERAVEPPVHELYRRALKLKGELAPLLEHARWLLQAMVVAKQDKNALALIRESLPADPSFAPYELEDTEHLAHVALQAGQTDLALSLLRGLLEKNEGHARFAAWALQASDLVVRRGEDLGLARDWLGRAASQCSSEDQQRRIEAQRTALGL